MKKFNAEYARACREHCRPLGCNDDPRCWVKCGTVASLSSGAGGGTPRCAACSGVIRERKYLSSEGLGTPAASRPTGPAG